MDAFVLDDLWAAVELLIPSKSEKPKAVERAPGSGAPTSISP